MVEKRGSVGETTFHVCFLMQTPTHLTLGKRMLKWYPKLINDVYLSEEYYGVCVLSQEECVCKNWLNKMCFAQQERTSSTCPWWLKTPPW